MKGPWKIGILILALALLGGTMALLAGFFETKIPLEAGRNPLPDKDGPVLKVAVQAEPSFEQAAGTIRSRTEAAIAPLITATIAAIQVSAGDLVERGDVLVVLDSRELAARRDQAQQGVAAAKIMRARAERDFKRIQDVFKTAPGAISKMQYDRARAEMQTARTALVRAQRRMDESTTALSYGRITAPFPGRIIDRYAEPGDTARQGQPLLRMYDPSAIRVEAGVRESLASRLHRGQPLVVRVDSLNQDFEAVVEEIVPSADPGSRSVLVKAGLSASAGLYPGMFARLLIPTGTTENIYIPLEAVIHVGQLDYVIVKTTRGPGRRFIRLGTPAGDRVAVLSGLQPGEEIFLDVD
ncbi:MAG: efflux RND transporter periplasmic adaptor subunit [Desulfosarcina sp.]|nr:efflux RND transporter periplasmic adaptor subunit [Desulfobacterales bacterium]